MKGEKHGSRASTDEGTEEWRAVNKQPKRGTAISGHVIDVWSYLWTPPQHQHIDDGEDGAMKSQCGKFEDVRLT